ncbi:TIGR00730 family Rossman fold protein [bacterium]|nr:TIGR00730 family Rossman fold protein [bacterium]
MTNKNGIKKICVYSSSSKYLREKYYEISRELGRIMVANGYDLVYGGGSTGTMIENAKAVKSAGGKVTGIIPEKLRHLEVENKDCDELIITPEMRSRKEKLDVLSDATIAISGGFGTLEELSEMIVQKQLGYNDKAIVILNTDGFYDDLLKFFDRIMSENFANEVARELYYVAKTPQEAVDYINTYVPVHADVRQKWQKNSENETVADKK